MLIEESKGSAVCPLKLLKQYFLKTSIVTNSDVYIFRPIHCRGKQKTLVSTNNHSSHSTYRESFSLRLKASFKTFPNTVRIQVDREGQLWPLIPVLTK